MSLASKGGLETGGVASGAATAAALAGQDISVSSVSTTGFPPTGSGISGTTSVKIGSYSASEASIWFGQATPGTTNFAFLGTSTTTQLNAPTTLYFGVGGNALTQMASDGYLVWRSGVAAKLAGTFANGASAIGVILDNQAALSTAGSKLLSVRNNAVEKLAVGFAGDLITNKTISAVAATSATANTPSGQHVLTATNATFTLTNSLVATTSLVLVTLATAPGLATTFYATAASGSFTLNFTTAPTSNTTFNWWVLN